ncbi:MAG: glycosyltransferase family 2 protein [Anaerolineales bacterium]|nr:glycosyltransferase family 2 protein [Anaerolineales bacterium]MCB8983665.1 glycosyltransferase family 2 protein [Ardenticatenaceae bacterium]
MIKILSNLLLAFQSVLAGLVSYLLLLTAAALRAPKTTKKANGRTHRFLILIPAHNEEKLLPDLLANLRKLDYPTDSYAVHVVADNCTDNTAVIARQHGATVHERFHQTLRGKGYALQWLLAQIQNTPHDAIVILDADSIISQNFLQAMNARLANGERVIQAYYAVRAPEQSSSAGLRYAALAVLHYLRPQGRMVLGGSAGLKGNGMVFVADLLRQHEWSASLTEDIEFHMQLILAGERVTFAPDAVVWAEMPDTLAASQTQNARWEQGRLEMARQYVPILLRRAAREGNFALFDAAMEHLIPPFSVLAGLSLLGMGTAVFQTKSRRATAVALGAYTILAQIIYLLAGLRLANAPRAVYRALLGIPRFLLWKIRLYLGVLLGQKEEGWVRTGRNE